MIQSKLIKARNALNQIVASEMEGGCLPEADDQINDASRQVIFAMAEQHGEAWLGKINLYDQARVKNGGGRDEQILWKYDGGMVYNFGADFVVPGFDQELVDLIRARDAQPWTSVANDVPMVYAISERIQVLGGVSLIWT